MFEQTYYEIRHRLGQSLIGLIPLGSVKNHGPHLPANATSLIASHYSLKVSESLQPYVFNIGEIPYGVEGIISLKPEVLNVLLTNILENLSKLGLKKIVLLNADPINDAFLKEFVSKKPIKDVELLQLNIWENYPDIQSLEGEPKGGSGGAYLTSQLLFIDRGLVREDRMKYADSSMGVEGNVSKARVEIGEIILSQTTRALIEKIEEFMRK
ncbi:MAG: creatininase family protein [Crenarchaeota archaeon]|nr:creatininase family protein [Thermoproteota archaeon]MDW8033475.1 creatininase family protein [Nitrososphaerota archaeon]